jgi:hypothetical protein
MDKFLAKDSLTGAKYLLMEGRIPDEAGYNLYRNAWRGYGIF